MRCPLRAGCRAHLDGRAAELPRPRRRPAARTLALAAILVRRQGRLLLVRRRSGRLLRDWWEVPTCRTTDDSLGGVYGTLASACGVSARDLRPAGTITHSVLSTRLQVRVLAGRGAMLRQRPRQGSRPAPAVPAGRATPLANLDLDALELRWADARECRALPLSTLTRKAVRCSAAADSTWLEYLNE
jgi:A/G-specific adenine glycosylase